MIDWVELSRIAPSIVVMLAYAVFTERMRREHNQTLKEITNLWAESIKSTNDHFLAELQKLSQAIIDHDRRSATFYESQRELIGYLLNEKIEKKNDR